MTYPEDWLTNENQAPLALFVDGRRASWRIEEPVFAELGADRVYGYRREAAWRCLTQSELVALLVGETALTAIALLGGAPNRAAAVGALALVLVRRPARCVAFELHVGGAFAAYLLTPWNLEWHLSTSFDRLLLHAAPAVLTATLLTLGAELISTRGALMINPRASGRE